jgi:hypothetical protein
MILGLSVSLAIAGTGPWVMSPGAASVYGGVEVQQFSRLATSSGSGAEDVISVDQGVSTLGVKVIGAVGIVRGVQVEAELPWFAVNAHTTDGPLCSALGLGACAPTQGIGVPVVRLQGQILDEVYGAPFSLSLGLDARFGQLTAGDRERITNLGEGTFDLEPRLSAGVVGGFWGGYASVAADAGFRYRFPMRRDFPGQIGAIPGYEITHNSEILWTPRSLISFGPSFSLLWRPDGVDVETTDMSDVDRFAALRVLSANLGGKVILRFGERFAANVSVFHTAYAVNNPTNVLAISAGLSMRLSRPPRPSAEDPLDGYDEGVE